MPAPEPTFTDPASLATFELRDDDGQPLRKLWPTLGIQGEVGKDDPFTWDHSPYSNNWFPLGDGIQRNRPTLTLAGEQFYDSINAAHVDIASISAALTAARELWWRGEKVDDLNQLWPGSYKHSYVNNNARHIRHQLVLNTGRTLTGADLGGGEGGAGFLAAALPYPYEGETAAVLLLDFLILDPKRPVLSGHVANLGDTDFAAVLIDGSLRSTPVTVQPRTSLDLTFRVTGVELQPIDNASYVYQVVVQ